MRSSNGKVQAQFGPGVLGDRWFLAQRRGGAGKCGARCAHLGGAQMGRDCNKRGQQRNCMASLTGLARSAMVLIYCCLNTSSATVCLMAIRFSLILVVKIGCSPCFMGVSSSGFNSNCRGCHLRRHAVSRPAAQRQQDNHQENEQVTHIPMIVVACKSSTLTSDTPTSHRPGVFARHHATVGASAIKTRAPWLTALCLLAERAGRQTTHQWRTCAPPGRAQRSPVR